MTKKIMIIALSLIIILSIAAFVFMQQPMFGKLPAGERLERIKKSPHFKNGEFINLSPTPVLTEGVGFFSMMKEHYFTKNRQDHY